VSARHSISHVLILNIIAFYWNYLSWVFIPFYIIMVSGKAMACPQGRGLVIGPEKMKLVKKKEKENILAVY
jgi:hypothetical protein